MNGWLVRWMAVVTLGGLSLAGAGDRLVCGGERPNILWITAEDMSPTLGCWGDTYADTPHIDRLAKEGVRYTRAFATAPVCSPVRSCLITGVYATSLGTQRLRSTFPIPARMTGFPALLRQAGYFCTNNVKTDYNTSNEPDIRAASWDRCSGTAHWRDRPADTPFFSVFNIMTSHQSRTMVWPYDQFQREVQALLPVERHHAPDRAPVPSYYPDTPGVRRAIARFYDCVSVMDQTVGELLQQLRDDGLADDTIVFFYSDHGSGMPRHKRALLDSGMHVPLVIRFPAKYRPLAPSGPGTTVERLVSFVDFGPTVLSLCGIEAADYMQGIPFLGARSGAPRRYVYGARDRVDEAYDLSRSVRDQRYLYVHNFMPHLSYDQVSAYPDQGEIQQEIHRMGRQDPAQLSPAQRHHVAPVRPREELYDTLADPDNVHNLADLAEHADLLAQMRTALRQWILTTRDAGFLTEEQMWSRLAANPTLTPYDLARSPDAYPLEKLLDVASLAGTGPASTTAWLEYLRDGDAEVRSWAVLGLATLGSDAPPAHSSLLAALRDPSPSVRIEAAGLLVRWGAGEQALPILIAALDSNDPNVVLHAARTVELLGHRATAATAAIRAARARADGPGDLNMFIRFSTDAFLGQR